MTTKHDHRQSNWLIAGGRIIWCYQCGAWKLNGAPGKWHRPSGIGGPNPAMLAKHSSPNGTDESI